MPEFIEVKLKYPINVKASNGSIQSLDTIRLGRLKAKHLELLPTGLDPENAKIEPKQMIPLIAGLAGLTIEEIGELDFTDMMELANKLTELMGEFESQPIGDN